MCCHVLSRTPLRRERKGHIHCIVQMAQSSSLASPKSKIAGSPAAMIALKSRIPRRFAGNSLNLSLERLLRTFSLNPSLLRTFTTKHPLKSSSTRKRLSLLVPRLDFGSQRVGVSWSSASLRLSITAFCWSSRDCTSSTPEPHVPQHPPISLKCQGRSHKSKLPELLARCLRPHRRLKSRLQSC